MRRLFLLLLLVVTAVTPAAASREPTVAPAPEWVERPTIPAPNAALADRPVQPLLLTMQNRHQDALHETFVEYAIRVQNSQGLGGAGNIVIPWQPENSDLVVHHARILRGDTTIDLLAGGQQFTVLRRENNLESAMLDGVLTAVLQAEGLTVGDVLSVAFTVRRRPSAIPLRADNLYMAIAGAPTRRVLLRDIWPAGMPVRWQTTEALGRPRSRTTRWGRELVLDLADAEGSRVLDNAPLRYMFAESHQVTGWRDWPEIASLLAPLYETARQLSPDSPLRREIDRIAASSADPAARAMAALRLVQDDIRYLALSMGDGGYLPASADQTWSRRFGDCKGKTAVLVALLAGLGIEAEPVLVSTVNGDGLDQRLPSLFLFNHVIVRARIGGRSYWLDGTRIGDRDLAGLASSPFTWGLPVRAAGATLEALPWAPPAQPVWEVNVNYDASAGLSGPLPTRTESTFRGDLATEWRLAAQRVGTAEIERMFRDGFRDAPEAERPTEARYRENADGSITFTTVGRIALAWERAPASSAYRSSFAELSAESLEPLLRVEPDRRVPFLVPTFHTLTTETVILPGGGAGFLVEGADFERQVAGARIGRQVRIEGGRLVARSWFQFVTREIPAAEARSSRAAIEAVLAERAWLRAPSGFQPTSAPAPATAPASAERQQARAHTQRGYELMQEGRYDSAIAELDRAIALAPDWARPHANRAVSLVHRNRYDDAESALETAARLDDRDFVVHQARGFLELSRGRAEDAIAPLSRSLELEPRNAFTLGVRAQAYSYLGRYQDSLRDLDAAIAIRPDRAASHTIRAHLLAHLGRRDEAVLALERAAQLNPDNPDQAADRAVLLASLGRDAEAATVRAAAIRTLERMSAASPATNALTRKHMLLLARNGQTGEALAIADAGLRRQSDNVTLLAARCHVRALTNSDLPAALRDCNQALEYESADEQAVFARALTYLRMERWSEAAADLSELLSWSAANPDALWLRGIARIRQGERENGERDLAAARRYAFDIAIVYEPLGIRP
jgi:tetratricopeptide (TPR) repeat protein